MAEEDVNPIQINQVEILDTNSRMFKSWGSVEVRDRENDLLPMNEFRKIMPVIMKRGGILMDRHSNRQVGKILNFEFKEKQTPNGTREGVMITGEIFKDYEHDDMVWQGIKDGIYKGLSFGGRNKMKDTKFDKKGLTNILSKLEGFEFSLVPGMGNQEATMEEINYLAKSNVSKDDIKKPFAGYKDFEDCVSKNQDKGDPNAYCSVIMRKVEEANKEYSDDEVKKKSLTKKDLSLSQDSNKSDKYINEKELNKSMEADEIKKQNEMIEKNSNDIAEINKTLEVISKKLDVKKAEEEEDEKDKEKKKAAEEEDEKDKNKKKENDSEEEDKKPEEELEKEGGPEGEKKVQLPKVPAEDTGGGKPAEGGEGEDVKFIEKNFVKVEEFNEMKEKMDGLINKGATTPKPAQMINKVLGKDAPKTQQDIAKMIKARSQ